MPETKVKIAYNHKPSATYVDFEIGFKYLSDERNTRVKRKTIDKLHDAENRIMQPNENFLKCFPEIALPEEKDRS